MLCASRRLASYLGVSVDRLTGAVQRATGQSPLGLIHARLFTEARQMLENSGLQIAEIPVHLGFDDPAYFPVSSIGSAESRRAHGKQSHRW